MAAFGCIDAWVHCTAAGVVAPFAAMTLEEFRREVRRVIEVALMGQVCVIQMLAPALPQAER